MSCTQWPFEMWSTNTWQPEMWPTCVVLGTDFGIEISIVTDLRSCTRREVNLNSYVGASPNLISILDGFAPDLISIANNNINLLENTVIAVDIVSGVFPIINLVGTTSFVTNLESIDEVESVQTELAFHINFTSIISGPAPLDANILVSPELRSVYNIVVDLGDF